MTDLEATTSEARAPTLTRLERAAGVALGAQPIEPLPDGPMGSARAVLERVVGRFLERTPCVVSFSGGRDSSAVLAVATHVARRDGLALPIPFTFRFPGKALTEESDWQEHVITHLGLEEWPRVDLHDELDLLGDVARRCLTDFGLLWPANAYLHVPVFEAAAGGTVLTGLDGDGLFGDWRFSHAQSVLYRRVAPRPRDLIRVGFALAPAPLRRATYRRRGVFVPGWLSLAAGAEYADAVLDRASGEPRQWDRRVVWHAGARALHLAQRNLEVIGARDDVQVGNPLLHPEFLAALAHEGGAAGFGDRTQAMRHLVGDLLPNETVERESKAAFGDAVWLDQARAFIDSWDGCGLDAELVDPERLRSAWRAEYPVFHSWTMLHEAWLASHGATSPKVHTAPESV
ncbi:MAG TPA: asparagine synthase-related protein [Acidimicrobiales bacterium]|nr:asparagine synthase-related protein [Acidimicrobiales bacterium]